MKRLIPFITCFLFACFANINPSIAQVKVIVGTDTTGYTMLKEAFDAINLGTHTGALTVIITGNSAETASAVLQASGTGGASYSGITIRPSGGEARTITGNISGHLIHLNGADNVTIDGLNTGGNSLTITNTNAGSGASTIAFTNDATVNTIQKCTILGSSGSVLTFGFGVLYFGTGIVTGNDNNTIDQCRIGPAGTNLPICGIYSFGSSATIDNSQNSVTGNKIYDYYNTGASTSGMNINSNNSAWTITGNRFYQTATRLYTTASTHYGIFITSGSGYTISDNILGFADEFGNGTTNLVGSSTALGGTFPTSYTVAGAANATKYVAISGAFTAGGAVSSIQNNTISGYALYTSSSTSGTTGIFCGIAVNSGNVDIGTTAGNMIGTPSSSIYTACTSSGGAIAGIYVTSANTVNIQNNIFQNLDAMGTTTSTAGSVNPINVEGAGATVLISGNIIGNDNNPNLRTGNLTNAGGNLSSLGPNFTTASGTSLFQGIRNTNTGTVTIGTVDSPNTIHNVSINSTGSLALYRGIYMTAGNVMIQNNTIENLTSSGAGTSYSNGGLAGIGILIGGGSPTIAGNTIGNLGLANTGAGGYTLGGIVINNPIGALTISRNRIFNLSNASTSVTATTPGTASGIFIRGGGGVATMIDNNMISLGSGQGSNTTFMGIWAQYNTSAATTLNIYYNTVNIEGSVGSGAQPSMCLHRGDLSTTTPHTAFTIVAKNNIFTNTRTGGTGKHYAIANNYGAASSATGWSAGATDYNILNGNAATIGYWAGDQTFAGWQTASSCDANSKTAIPVTFVNAANGNLHLNMGTTPTQLESGGTVIATVTTDYDGQVRPGPAGSVYGGATAPDFGADEFDGVPFGVPANMSVSGELTTTVCYNATQVIYVAQSPNTYTIQPGGDATFIAGQQVIFYPGTWVKEGGHMLAKISDGTYCGGITPMAPDLAASAEPAVQTSPRHGFTVYPNPTAGDITIVWTGAETTAMIHAEIFDMQGSRVLTTTFTGRQAQVRTTGLPDGIYVVRLTGGGVTERVKLVKSR